MENALSRIVDALPGFVWTALSDGRLDFVNQRWCEYTGLGVDKAYGLGWQIAIHPEDRLALIERWQSILHAGEPSEIEARMRRFDGEYHWFLFRICPLVDESGQIVKWCGLNTDIEDRKRSEEALRGYWWLSPAARELHFHSIVNDVPNLATLMTPAGDVELVNRQVLEYFGATLQEVKGWAISDAVHPDDSAEVLAAWNRAVETGHPYNVESRLRRADGVYRWFHTHCFALRDMEGRVVLWYLLQTDIDDRKRVEALLAGEKRFLEMVAEGTSKSAILEALCRLVESTVSGCYCSVVLVDPGGAHLEHGAAPSLPASFITSIIGRPVNVDSGPCAMAAYLNEQVIAADLALETRWAAHAWCPMAMAHGLQACWSTPISSTAGKVLGAFAIYYDEPRTPTPQQQGLIDQFTHIASIAIERAQGDAALRDSEARKSAILDSALDCIVTIDHQGRITEFNPAAERTFGYRRNEVVGKHLADIIIPPSLREKHEEGLARYVATGEARVLGKRMEMTAVRSDGVEFPVELAITRIPLDGPPSFTGYLRDITERKQVEERLRRSEAFLAEGQRLSLTGSFSWRVAAGGQGELKDGSPGFIHRGPHPPLMSLDNGPADRQAYPHATGFGRVECLEQATEDLGRQPQARIGHRNDEIRWSEQIYRIFEFDPSVPVTLELIGSRVHPDDRPLLSDMVERARGDGGDFEFDHRLQMPDGSVKYLHLIGRGTRDKDGRLEYIGAVQDVTQRRLAEQALGEARSELAHVAKITSLGVLTASIAHEVNQPLSGIITNAGTCLRMLAADPPNLEGARTTANRTIRDGNRVADVISRLRALFSKKETATELVDLNEATREVIALSSGDLQRGRVILRPEFADDLPLVMGDRVQLQQVILNLLRNASDAMNSIDDRPRELVIRTESEQDDRVRVSVQDAGVGFDPPSADRLFDAFYTTKNSGMGIGLSVSRSIVESHHGRLWAKPNDGHGATFSFSIPCDPEVRSTPAILTCLEPRGDNTP